MIIYILGYVYRKGNNMTEIKANYSVGDKPEKKLTTYQLKVDKETWKKFKGTSYILGFDSVNDCLKHLIDECVKRAEYGDK